MQEQEITYPEIMPIISGFARIIKYTIINNSKNILDITEGQFEKGEKSGYCRKISAVDGTCEVGFYYKDEPKGKWCMYNLEGYYAEEEGLYDGTTC